MPEISLIGVLDVAAVAFPVPIGLGLFPSLRLPSVVLEIVTGVILGPPVSVSSRWTWRCGLWP